MAFSVGGAIFLVASICWKDIGQKEYVHEQSGGHAVRGESVSRHLLHGHTAPAPSANIRFLTFCPFLTAAQALQWRDSQEFKVRAVRRALVRQRLAHLGTAVGAIRPALSFAAFQTNFVPRQDSKR